MSIIEKHSLPTSISTIVDPGENIRQRMKTNNVEHIPFLMTLVASVGNLMLLSNMT
jgi:hypothetical protein